MLELLFSTKGIKTSDDAVKCKVKLNMERNSISTLSFTIYSTSSTFTNLFPKLTNVRLYDTTEPDVLKFEGTLYSKRDHMDTDGKTYSECMAIHIIDNLHSTSVAGFRMWSGNYSDGNYLFARPAIDKLFNWHNSNVPAEQQIEPIWDNRITNYVGISVDYISAGTTYEAIMANINRNDWDWKPVYVNGKWKMSIAEDYGVISKQHVIVGVNMKDISRSVDATDLVTRIIPVGAEGYIPFAKLNPDMDAMADVIGIGDQSWVKTGPVTLYGYDRYDPPYRVTGDDRTKIYIANPTLESKYPPIARVVEYSDISCEIADDSETNVSETDAYTAAQTKLYDRCKADVVALTDMIEGYETTAFDLSKAGYDFKHFELFDICHIVNNQLEINTWLQIIAIEIDYEKPMESKLTFGKIGRSLARQLARSGKTTSQKIADNSHKANETLNQRTGGLNFRRLSSSEYEDITNKNDNTLYTVDDAGVDTASLYIGEKRISGGGASTTVENATVLVPTNFHDFVIEEELILDIQPPNMLYYGQDTTIVCVQGHYMLQVGYDAYGAASYDSTLGWVINGSKDTYDAVIANLDKFGSQLGTETEGGFLITRRSSSSKAGPAYPEEYAYLNARIVSISGANATNSRYSVSVDERRARTNTPTGDWWEEDMTWGATTLYTHQQYLRAPDNNNAGNVPNTLQLQALYLVPVTRPYQAEETFATTIPLQTPYGYANMEYPILVAVFRDKSTGDLSYSLTNVDLTGANNRYKMPLISNAEKCFALGLTKRTEPVPSNGGGT